MSQNLYILPPDSLTMVIAVFAGLGTLTTIMFVVLTFLRAKSVVCKPPGKDDLEKLNTIEEMHTIKEDFGDALYGEKSEKDEQPNKKSKKDV